MTCPQPVGLIPEAESPRLDFSRTAKGPLSSGGPYPFGEYLNRDLGDNSGTSYEILAPAGRFILGYVGSTLVAFNPPMGPNVSGSSACEVFNSGGYGHRAGGVQGAVRQT